MIELYCQANPNCGWTLFGLTGTRLYFRSLGDVIGVASRTGAKLKIVDKFGYTLN